MIFGGRSGEHEVSIVSAQSVMKSLDRKKYDVVPIGITKKGSWIAGSKAVTYLKDGLKKVPSKSMLVADPTEHHLVPIGHGKPSPFALDVVIPVIHGTYGEDGTLQGLFELANIPYVGAGVLGSAVGMDKVVQKQLFSAVGLPVVKYHWFLSSNWRRNKKQICRQIEKKLVYPMFTKPSNAGSSVGISKCHNRRELALGINDAAQYDRKIVVEQGIENIHEIEVAVLGNDNPRSSVPGEIIPSNEFYDYDAKYVDGKSQAIIPAKLPITITRQLRELAVRSFLSLDLAGMARVDFLVTKKTHKIFINEVNTIPGFTSISMYPKLWEASGLSYSKLLDKLIALALSRHGEKQTLATSYQPRRDWHK